MAQKKLIYVSFKCDLDARTHIHLSKIVTAISRFNASGLNKKNIYTKLFLNPRINVKVMVPTSSIYDHFIIWSSIVTLTFNLPRQRFQMALLLLQDNTCSKLFWNLFINVGLWHGQANLWPFYHLTFKCDSDLQPKKKKFNWHYSSSRTKSVLNNFEIHALM